MPYYSLDFYTENYTVEWIRECEEKAIKILGKAGVSNSNILSGSADSEDGKGAWSIPFKVERCQEKDFSCRIYKLLDGTGIDLHSTMDEDSEDESSDDEDSDGSEDEPDSP